MSKRRYSMPGFSKHVPKRTLLGVAAAAVVAGGGTTAFAVVDTPDTGAAAQRPGSDRSPGHGAQREHQRAAQQHTGHHTKRHTKRHATAPRKHPAAGHAAHDTVAAKKITKPKKTTASSAHAASTGGHSAPAGGHGGATCQASTYGTGQMTASGESFDPNALTAAHKTLPFGSKVKVTNTATGKSVVVRINDRGPFVAGRCLDLSTAAFGQIASGGAGVATVSYTVLSGG